MRKLIIVFVVLLLVSPVVAKEHKGHKAGGVRADHASESGMEHGKAWAGSKEKKVKDDTEEETEKLKKEKKEKKTKKKNKK